MADYRSSRTDALIISILMHTQREVYRLQWQVASLQEEIRNMSAVVDHMRSSVEKNTTVTLSVIALVSSMAQQIKDAAGSGDLEQVMALADQLDANNTQIAALVTANTPVAGENQPPAPGTPTGEPPRPV